LTLGGYGVGLKCGGIALAQTVIVVSVGSSGNSYSDSDSFFGSYSDSNLDIYMSLFPNIKTKSRSLLF
jgi:hypothetical protein